MAQAVRKVDHFHAGISHKVGSGARVLGALAKAGVDFIALWAYHVSPSKAMLEMIPKSSSRLVRAAKKAGLKLGKKDTAFHLSGADRRGVVARALAALGKAGINVGAVQGVCAGGGRYGAILYVGQADVRKAAKTLGAG